VIPVGAAPVPSAPPSSSARIVEVHIQFKHPSGKIHCCGDYFVQLHLGTYVREWRIHFALPIMERRIEKPLRWVGSSRRDLRDFPPEARREAGFNLDRVQTGRTPRNWKPLDGVGTGVIEIRITTSEGGTREHRVVYVARFSEGVYVLHAFEKKSRKTSRHDVDVAKARYSEMLRMRTNSEGR
jgi:phage-related protein